MDEGKEGGEDGASKCSPPRTGTWRMTCTRASAHPTFAWQLSTCEIKSTVHCYWYERVSPGRSPARGEPAALGLPVCIALWPVCDRLCPVCSAVCPSVAPDRLDPVIKGSCPPCCCRCNARSCVSSVWAWTRSSNSMMRVSNTSRQHHAEAKRVNVLDGHGIDLCVAKP